MPVNCENKHGREEEKMSSSLKVKDLCKTYVMDKRQNNVLKNVSFSVSQGEMVAIMGPSGSGKSTLLYTVSGMDKMTAGSVDFFGKDLSSLKADELAKVRLVEMGFIFQQMYMLKNLSIYDNIILPAYQAEKGKGGRSRKEINEQAQELMRKLDIMQVADNDINEVSGGQLQRACICRSLINHPKIIFADEPTGSLNKQASYEVMKELNRINREGTSVLLVTHDVRVAAKSDRVVYLVDGKIEDEYKLGRFQAEQDIRDRERILSSWLMEMGW